MPRLPWRWIVLGTLSISTVTAGYLLKEQQKADNLRSLMVQVHEQELAEPARRYLEFRGKLERLIMEAGKGEPETYADKRLNLGGLRAGQGLYLRIQAQDAKDAKSIAKAVLATKPDVIPSCLGLSPASARGLWEKGEFLMPEWLEERREQDRVMDLRVTDEVLARHIRADLPAVLNMLRAHWFMLVLQQGPNRREHPVDVFLWDLRRDQQLLRARVQSAGVLLSARIRSQGSLVPGPGAQNERMNQGSANDCSIAAQLKQITGAGLATVEHLPVADGGVAGGTGAESENAPNSGDEAAPRAADAGTPIVP
jgi:hypothetical protein